jgi:hypothetical protein
MGRDNSARDAYKGLCLVVAETRDGAENMVKAKLAKDFKLTNIVSRAFGMESRGILYSEEDFMR